MARTAGDLANKPCNSAKNAALLMRAKVDIGATGAPTLDATKSTPGISITRADTGDYDIVFPGCHFAFVQIGIVSPLATVIAAVVTAKDSAAGTASLLTVDAAGAAADPASGDDLEIVIWAIPREHG